MMSRTAILIAALFGTAAAFAPSALPMGLRQRAATSKISGLRMGGADRVPPGPAGRGPFDKSDSFVLPDGRLYQPGDACSNDIYGAALESPIVVGDQNKNLILSAAFLGFSVLLPTFLVKVVIGM